MPKRYFGRLLQVVPSPAVAALIVPGFLLETVSLLLRQDHSLRLAGVAFGVYVLACMWLLFGFVVWTGAAAVGALSRRFPRAGRAAGAALLAVLYVVCLLYLLSWLSYLDSGMFLTYESLRAVFHGFRFTLFMVLQSSGWYLLLFLFLAAAAAMLFPWVGKRLVSSHWGARPSLWAPLYSFAILAGGLVVGMVLYGRLILRGDAALLTQRAIFLTEKLNPAFTLGWTTYHWGRGTIIEPHLQLAELEPLSREPARRPGEGNRRSVIFLAVESLRADLLNQIHQGREIMPNLNRLARNSAVFTRTWSQSTHTDYAIISYLSSLYPLRDVRHHYYDADDSYPRRMIYDILKDHGYNTAVITSDNTAWSEQRQYMQTPSLDLFFDSESTTAPTNIFKEDTGFELARRGGLVSAGTLPDRYTANVICEWLQERAAAEKPFFLHTFFQDMHFPYELPPDAERPFQPAQLDFPKSFLFYPPKHTEQVRNAYYNAAHEVDRQIGRLLQCLRDTGLEQKIILVLVGDHGEAFWENGIVTHAGLPYETVLRIPALIYAPGLVAPCQDDYPTELIDMAPTVLNLLGLPAEPNFQGMVILSDDRVPVEERNLFFHVESGLASADGIIWGGKWKLWANRRQGKYHLTDLQSDPGEQVNLEAVMPDVMDHLKPRLRQWRDKQLSYYHFPFYFERYYPPQFH